MGNLVLTVFDVGNGDCIWVSLPANYDVAVDFSELYTSPIEDGTHPALVSGRGDSSNKTIACLSHPHRDHMGEIDEMAVVLELVAKSGGEFWSSVSDWPRYIDLYRDVAIKTGKKVYRREFRKLARIADRLARLFEREQVRFVACDLRATTALPTPPGIRVEILSPTCATVNEHMKVLHDVATGRRVDIPNDSVNRTSIVLKIQNGENVLLLGGDAPSSIWREIMKRIHHQPPQPMRAQVIKASHHGSDDAFYPGLWDDLFGDEPGIVVISANGSSRPTLAFMDSFEDRCRRGIQDQVRCTGRMTRIYRERLPARYVPVLDQRSTPVERGDSVQHYGTITVVIPSQGTPSIAQEFVGPA